MRKEIQKKVEQDFIQTTREELLAQTVEELTEEIANDAD